jgi:histidinol dehydrogenase
MIAQLDYSDSDFYARLETLLKRDLGSDSHIDATVKNIIERVRKDGDQAVIELTAELDHVQLDADSLELQKAEIERHAALVDGDLALALQAAADRIRRFHEKQQLESWSYCEDNGTRLGQIVTPLRRAGVYVPGGKASYPSSVLMTVIPARVAGVSEVIMTVPTPHGEINSAVIAAARIAGVDRIFTIGGAQAIAALAYGTESVPAVDKIAGPGNAYVAAAKKMVFGDVGIDMVAGPSEVVVIADESANAQWVAMDMFAQAEHDELAQAIAITTSATLVDRINHEIETRLPKMQRRDIIEKSLADNGAVILVESLQQAAEVSNHIAPEHLELVVEDVNALIELITNAGAIFAGEYSAEALGDYCAGPNHVLPTSGTARFSSPLGVYDFQKRSSILHATAAGASEMAAIATVLARSEGLSAHEQAARYRGSPNTGSSEKSNPS